jgi:hypothetical protein
MFLHSADAEKVREVEMEFNANPHILELYQDGKE